MLLLYLHFSSVHFSCSFVSESLWPHGLQHTRLLCPPLSPRAGSNSCALSQWRYLTNPSSVVPFSFCLHYFPTSGSFPMSRHFASDGQRISFSFSISPSNECSGLISFGTDWSPCCPRDSQESSPAPQFKSINSLALSFLYGPPHIHIWLLEKP